MNTYLVNGHVVTANSKSEVVASKGNNLDRERLFLEQYGFKFKKQNGYEYAYKRMPESKHVVATIHKNDRGIFVAECYV